MRRLAKTVPWGLILLAPVTMLYPLWWNPVSAGEDDLVYYYPLRVMTGQAIRAAITDAAPPATTGLAELMRDPGSAVLFPPTAIFAFAPHDLAYSLSIFLAFALGGAGTYLYARALSLRREAACFATVALMFSGFFVGHRVHLGMIQTAAFIPWGLWGIECLRTRRRVGFAALAAVFYLAITAGHWPILIQGSVLWAAYFLFRARPFWRCVLPAAAAAAIALVAAGPQIYATAVALSGSTRPELAYPIAGENSFFPPAGILFLFPMLMGVRRPGFFPQAYWGPWHHCEMLGYVGLVTLVLAGACVWTLGRRDRRTGRRLDTLVRTWTWIAAGALVWMLGYYLPTYRIIHAIPVLNMVRCPARMIVALDMALAVLAGIAIDRMAAAAPTPEHRRRLGRSIRLTATVVLPLVMLGVLVALGVVGAGLLPVWPGQMVFPMSGGARDLLGALRPTNPAVWIPLGVLLATIVAVRGFVRNPRRVAALLVLLLLGDLFVITRFVDIGGAGPEVSPPLDSPAARFLRRPGRYQPGQRVWGLGRDYHDRPIELLLPLCAQAMGFESIARYGPLQSPDRAHLLGLRTVGTSPDWARLIRRNALISAYNVRYLLAADRRFREVIESVRIPNRPARREGPNLLTDTWELDGAEAADGRIRLKADWLWDFSTAVQNLRLRPREQYRLALDVRAAEGSAGQYLRVEVNMDEDRAPAFSREGEALMIYPSQMGADWRHFERTFTAPEKLAEWPCFKILTPSERPIEVRDVSLRASAPDVPIRPAGRGEPGQVVYRKLVELPAAGSGEPPVVIYENTLCEPPGRRGRFSATPGQIEHLRRSPRSLLDDRDALLPRLSLPTAEDAPNWAHIITMPIVALYLVGTAGWMAVRRRTSFRRRRNLGSSGDVEKQ